MFYITRKVLVFHESVQGIPSLFPKIVEPVGEKCNCKIPQANYEIDQVQVGSLSGPYAVRLADFVANEGYLLVMTVDPNSPADTIRQISQHQAALLADILTLHPDRSGAQDILQEAEDQKPVEWDFSANQ